MAAKEGSIKYRLGVSVQGIKKKLKTIQLFGTWKMGKRATLNFEMKNGQGNIKAIKFKAELRFKKRDKTTVMLRNSAWEDLGMSVRFDRNFFKKDAHWFLQLEKMSKGSALRGGLNFRW